jgi:hypothetical protein
MAVERVAGDAEASATGGDIATWEARFTIGAEVVTCAAGFTTGAEVVTSGDGFTTGAATRMRGVVLPSLEIGSSSSERRREIGLVSCGFGLTPAVTSFSGGFGLMTGMGRGSCGFGFATAPLVPCGLAFAADAVP